MSKNYQILGVVCTWRERNEVERFSNFLNFSWYTPYDFQKMEIWGYRIDEARTRAVEYALEKDIDYLLFIDDDIFVHNSFLMEMMSRFEKYKADIVVGNYFLKTSYMASVTRIIKPDDYAASYGEIQTMEEEELNENYKFETSGLGATIIKRSVLEEIEKPYFECTEKIDNNWYGEDTYFFKKVRDKFKVWVSWDIPIIHKGPDQWYGREKDIKKIYKDLNDLGKFSRRVDVDEEWPPKVVEGDLFI